MVLDMGLCLAVAVKPLLGVGADGGPYVRHTEMLDSQASAVEPQI